MSGEKKKSAAIVILLIVGIYTAYFWSNGLRNEDDKSAEMEQFDYGDPDVNLIMGIFNRISLVDERGYEALSTGEKILYNVNWLEVEVNNGGFDQYFFNPAGNYAHETIQSLKIIGATYTASLLENACSIFENDRVPKYRFLRQEQLLEISESQRQFLYRLDDEFYEYRDNLAQLQKTYIDNHADEFDISAVQHETS